MRSWQRAKVGSRKKEKPRKRLTAFHRKARQQPEKTQRSDKARPIWSYTDRELKKKKNTFFSPQFTGDQILRPTSTNYQNINMSTMGRGYNSAHLLSSNLVNKGGATSRANAPGTINVASIRCHVCKVVRPVSEYSNRQLQKYQNSVYNPYIPGGRSKKDNATCKRCTAGPIEELHCFNCDLDKPLSKFMKSQRNNPQKARCRACVQFCLDTERDHETPNIDEYVEDPSDESDDVDEGEDEDEDEDEDDDEQNKQSETESDVDVDNPQHLSAKKSTNPSRVSSAVSTPITQRGTLTPSSRSTPLTELDQDDDGGWTQVKFAGKTNSAFRSAWSSRATSGITSPMGSSSNGISRASLAASGLSTPLTSMSSTQGSSTQGAWGKPTKLKPTDVVQSEWHSEKAARKGWTQYGGQPALFKKKKTRRAAGSDDDDDDDDE
ncbi:Stc1 domain-containing protein [Kalaharituber pfeilii]|nr:Stc1 domain-containing protein [Kalaharituber pfeilii]